MVNFSLAGDHFDQIPKILGCQAKFPALINNINKPVTCDGRATK